MLHTELTYKELFAELNSNMLALNAAMGRFLLGYSFDEVVNRVPLFARISHHISQNMEMIEQAADEVYSYLPAVWAWRRNYFEVQGMKKVRVYRGLSLEPAAEIIRQLSDPKTEFVDFGTNFVSSWTTDKEYAYRYAKGIPEDKMAGVVVSLNVPVERIVYASEATKELEEGEAPWILIWSVSTEIFRIPRDSIEVLRYERLHPGGIYPCPDPFVTTETPGMDYPVVEIDNEIDAYTWLTDAEDLMEYDKAHPNLWRDYEAKS